MRTLCRYCADIVRTYISRDICPHYILLRFSALVILRLLVTSDLSWNYCFPSPDSQIPISYPSLRSHPSLGGTANCLRLSSSFPDSRRTSSAGLLPDICGSSLYFRQKIAEFSSDVHLILPDIHQIRVGSLPDICRMSARFLPDLPGTVVLKGRTYTRTAGQKVLKL